MRYVLQIIGVFLMLNFGPLLHGQNLVPHPYAFGGLEGMGGGYAPLAEIGGGGLRIDSRRVVVDGNGWYDNGHKINDNDQPNPTGHDRGLTGVVYLRLPSGWAIGPGARWSQLSTTNYKKSAWEPTVGGSKDYFSGGCKLERCYGGFSMQMRVDYMLKGSDWQNGTQGPLFTIYIPSPAAKAHVMYRETVGVYRFYDTVTDRTNAILTREQMSNHSWDSFAEFTIMFRL